MSEPFDDAPTFDPLAQIAQNSRTQPTVRAIDGAVIAECYGPDAQAHAQLISAASEVLAECSKTLAKLASVEDLISDSGPDSTIGIQFTKAEIASLRAAIQKATV